MDGALRDAAYALIGLTMLSALAQRRVEHAANRDLSRPLKGGWIRTSVRPRGIFGLMVGESSTTRIAGAGFESSSLPFYRTPGRGPVARVGKLELDFHDITLRSLPVRSLRATIPNVTLDLARAFWDDHIAIRSAGIGPGEAIIGEEGLRSFVARKYPQFQDVDLSLQPGVATIRAKAALFGLASQLEARSGLEARGGRYLYAVKAMVKINDREAAPALVKTLLDRLNPVVDTYRDLGLGGYFEVTAARIEAGRVVVTGRVTVPPQPPRNLPQPAAQPRPVPGASSMERRAYQPPGIWD